MHKKKAKVLVIGISAINLGDAGSGKSTLVQSFAKKNYQFTSDYNIVLDNLIIDTRCRSLLQNFIFSRIINRC